jgi:hypothetical protein
MSAAPLPWKISGTTIVDATDRLVVLLAGRLTKHPEILAKVAAACEMHEALKAAETYLIRIPLARAMIDDRDVLALVQSALQRASGSARNE